MKIVVLGSTGMLGSSVYNYLATRYRPSNVFPSYRSKVAGFDRENEFYFDPYEWGDPPYSFANADYVVNCIGVIKPFIDKDPPVSVWVNSYFPWRLADHCRSNGMKLIHITSDCVFSGKDGNYHEKSAHDCTDFYGKSKSLGEPDDCMVLRTSIIGEEIHKNASLVEWAKSQAGKSVRGFTNHLWNGVTTKQYAEIVAKIIDNGLYEPSLFHVFSDVVTKEQLLRLLDKRFNLNLAIDAVAANESVNRVLYTVKDLNSKLSIPSLAEQIDKM